MQYLIKLAKPSGAVYVAKHTTPFTTTTDNAAKAEVYNSSVDNPNIKLPFFAALFRSPASVEMIEVAR
jgi:hypothetical protein